MTQESTWRCHSIFRGGRPKAMPTTWVLLTVSVLVPAAVGESSARELPERPNVVILMTDDQGHADLSICGSDRVETPVLDSLARQGAMFTDFYGASAVCSPSRASLLTGRSALRTGVYSWLNTEQNMHLRIEEITYARILRDAGYDTAHVGKWHLGYALYDGVGEGPMAGQGGFRLHGSTQGPNPYDHGFDYWMATGNNAHPSHRNPENFVRNGQAVGKIEGYSSHIVIDEAIHWLQEHRDPANPFLLNIWFNEPHRSGGPAAPPEYEQRHADSRLPGYYGSIEYLDKAVGKLMAKLEAMGETENTLVVFTSDHGSYLEGSNRPFTGRKTNLWEGGIRVPGIFYWPAVIEPGMVVSEPAGMVDVLPTLCDIVGVDVPSDRTIDGMSILPLLEGGSTQRGTPLYWFYSPSRPVCVIRDGDWSLVADPTLDLPTQNWFEEEFIGDIKRTELTNFRLYNLRSDPRQQHDLSERRPRRFEAMKRTMLEMHAEIVAEAFDWREFEW